VWKVWRRNFDVFMKTFKVNFFPPLLEPIFYLAALWALAWER
jgi:lipooligosaccharide transport system permease protein